MKWKGKKVSKKRYFDLRRNVEFRLVGERGHYGFMYKPKPYKIGGKKNGQHIRAGFY
jgi:hypothetical protein